MRGEELFEILTEIFQKSLKKKSQKQKHTKIILFVQGLILQALNQAWALIL